MVLILPTDCVRPRNVVITERNGQSIAVTALEGMGGIGKSVLTAALCHDEVVQQVFPDSG
jgi:hypothetical protein